MTCRGGPPSRGVERAVRERGRTPAKPAGRMRPKREPATRRESKSRRVGPQAHPHINGRGRALHRPPRHPHAWAVAFLVSQLLLAALWWRFGWRVGVPGLLVSHGALVWATLWPRSRWMSRACSTSPSSPWTTCSTPRRPSRRSAAVSRPSSSWSSPSTPWSARDVSARMTSATRPSSAGRVCTASPR